MLSSWDNSVVAQLTIEHSPDQFNEIATAMLSKLHKIERK